MRAVSRYGAPMVLLLALIAVSWLKASAEEVVAGNDPAVVVSVANMDRLLADIGYLTRSAGMQQVGQLVTLMAAPYLEGLDTKRPAGFLLTLDGALPSGVVFVPVTDFASVLKKVEEQVGKPEQLGEGILKLSLQRDIFIKQQGTWVFVADQAANVASVPEDPSRLLDGLDRQYAVAVRLNATRVPEQIKEMALNGARKNVERALQEANQSRSAEDRRRLEEVSTAGLGMLASLVHDTDQVTLGWGTDSKAGKTFVEATITAQPDTGLARHMANSASVPSSFAGFSMSDAAVTLTFSAAVPKEAAAAARGLAAEARRRAVERIDKNPKIAGADAKSAVKEAANTLFDVALATLEQGRVDTGAALVLAPQAVRFAVGGWVSDGALVEGALRKIADAGRSQPGFPEVRFDAENYRSVDFHTLSVPVSPGDDEIRKVFGEQLDAVLGTGRQSVFVALGRDSAGLLKSVLDASASANAVPGSPARALVSLTPVLRFAASMDNDKTVAALADALAKSPDRDHVSLTARHIDHGAVYRLEVEDGIFQLVAAAARLQGTESSDP